MIIDKSSRIPIYLQLKNYFSEQINKGLLMPGEYIPTEHELCSMYDISRYPVRQAMDELVSEGYLIRVKGRGTFVDPDRMNIKRDADQIGLIVISHTGGLQTDILAGFEKHARQSGQLISYACSENSAKEELLCAERMIKQGIKDIALFPSDNSMLPQRLDEYISSGVRFVLIDRDAGIKSLDYVGSDNYSGAYMAVRHLAFAGFSDIIFVSSGYPVSSINERLAGYSQAIADCGLTEILRTQTDKDLKLYPTESHRFKVERLKEDILGLFGYGRIGVFAVNDHAAIQCMDILSSSGYEIGVNAGVVGFDDVPEAKHQKVPLTTIAQNGVLVGKEAARMLIEKSGVQRKVTVPAQIVIRKSCGE